MNEIGENLKRVRLLKNFSLKKAGELLGMSDVAVSKYEKGQLKPNSQKLIQFANAYGVMTNEFFKSYDGVKMKFDCFRKKQRLKGQKFELLKDLIQHEVSNYLNVLELNNLNKNMKFEKMECSSLEDAEKAANRFRAKVINISNIQPISDLTSILENLGIVIVYVKNYDNRFNDFEGLSEIVNGIPVIVLLDGVKDGARQRFTIAHELGHLVLDIKGDVNEEKMCNRFASALLMPKEAMINEFGEKRSNLSFYELVAFKNEYKVSYLATIHRLRDLGIISEYSYRNICMFLNGNALKKDPSPIAAEKSYQFKKLVYKLEVNGVISVSKACELLGVNAYEYNKENYNYRY